MYNKHFPFGKRQPLSPGKPTSKPDRHQWPWNTQEKTPAQQHPFVLLVGRGANPLYTVAGTQIVKTLSEKNLFIGPFFGHHAKTEPLDKVRQLYRGVHICYPYDHSRSVLAIVWPDYPHIIVTHSYPREGGRLKGWLLDSNPNFLPSASKVVCTRTRMPKLYHVDKITNGVYLCHTEDAFSFLALVSHELEL